MDNPHFNEDELKEILENIHKAKKLGILPDETRINENFDIRKPVKITENNSGSATSSSLLYDGRPPRSDVFLNLKGIGKFLQSQLQSYPWFTPKQLEMAICQICGNKEGRTMKKYFDSIVRFSKKHKKYGLYDVSGFCIMAIK